MTFFVVRERYCIVVDIRCLRWPLMFNWVASMPCLCRHSDTLFHPRSQAVSPPLPRNWVASPPLLRYWSVSPLSIVQLPSLASPYNNHPCPRLVREHWSIILPNIPFLADSSFQSSYLAAVFTTNSNKPFCITGRFW